MKVESKDKNSKERISLSELSKLCGFPESYITSELFKEDSSKTSESIISIDELREKMISYLNESNERILN